MKRVKVTECIFCGQKIPDEMLEDNKVAFVDQRGSMFRKYFHVKCFYKEVDKCRNSKLVR